jgi:hypothetical protein
MGQPVKLSDGLLNEARVVGAAMGRSMAGQVEFWASLGRDMERVMTGGKLMQVRQRSIAAELQEALETVNEPLGRARLQAYLESKPYPRFMAHPTKAEVFIREDADGSRTEGHMVGREFVPLQPSGSSEAA